ncbi:MAG: response regulator [Anaerohalosphaeraceae bacterium]
MAIEDLKNPVLSALPAESSFQTAVDRESFSAGLFDQLAYQIRTLSNAVIGFCNLLAAEDLTDTQREYVAEIHRAGKGLSCIVNDVVDFVRLERGTLKPNFAECDLADLIEEMESILSRAAVSKGLSFSITVEENVPAFLRTDRARLMRCLLNLAGNAIQFTQQGQIELRVRMDSLGSQSVIRFDLSDTGLAISTEHWSELFDPTRQAGGLTAGILPGAHGCGLLPMTRQLVHLLNGQLEITSRPGAGSTFSIVLSAEPAVQKSRMLSFPPHPEQNERHENLFENKRYVGRVLLVEDEESNRTVLTLMLENLGLDVTAVGSGQAAVKTACRIDFDVILMDIQLPDISGLQAARQLREIGLQTPMIALSAGTFAEGQAALFEELFDAFLAKPVDGPQLADVLQPLLPSIQKSQTQSIVQNLEIQKTK